MGRLPSAGGAPQVSPVRQHWEMEARNPKRRRCGTPPSFQEHQTIRHSTSDGHPPFIAAEGDEMQIPPAVIAFQFPRHKSRKSPPFPNPGKGRAPSHQHSKGTFINGMLSSYHVASRKTKPKGRATRLSTFTIRSQVLCITGDRSTTSLLME